MTDLRPGMTVNIVTIPAVAAERPDNTWPGYDYTGAYCAATDDGMYTCTAPASHTGDHMAYGNSGYLYHQWPDGTGETSNGYEPDHRLRCNDEDDLNGYICTARAGHDGPHMGWYGPGARQDDATW